MLKLKTRLLTGAFVATDAAATGLAWLLAYQLRFHADLVTAFLPITKGVPDFSRYLLLLPLILVLWPAVLYFHGLYQLKRSHSRIDELFGIVMSVVIGSALTLAATLYVRVYHRYQPEVSPAWEYSQGVFALFIVLNVVTLYAGRHLLRLRLQRMWAAGINVTRVLVAGAGPLGQMVAEALGAHRDLGYRVLGFLDDQAGAETVEGLPLLGSLDQAVSVANRLQADQLYVALPLEQHAELLRLIKTAGNECLDIRVVPDLIQHVTMRASLEDLDGIPIIALNEVPLRGLNAVAKRLLDLTLGSLLLAILTLVVPVFPVVALLIRWKGGRGPVFLRQERMTLDGRTFQIWKFRTMVDEAEKETGPVWATPEDPRRTPIGIWLRRFNLDELPQLINVVRGEMSLVGPRPERPPFVSQFKERIPQYMLRHRVKSGITGWAQVNGWRGNTSLEKRIEFDLYYIENWSLLLDLKILILTLFRGFGQKHAY
jgi:Undecaprenyl-phosphate glucose phosphotransferase